MWWCGLVADCCKHSNWPSNSVRDGECPEHVGDNFPFKKDVSKLMEKLCTLCSSLDVVITYNGNFTRCSVCRETWSVFPREEHNLRVLEIKRLHLEGLERIMTGKQLLWKSSMDPYWIVLHSVTPRERRLSSPRLIIPCHFTPFVISVLHDFRKIPGEKYELWRLWAFFLHY
jgi:hypothetical protein